MKRIFLPLFLTITSTATCSNADHWVWDNNFGYITTFATSFYIESPLFHGISATATALAAYYYHQKVRATAKESETMILERNKKKLLRNIIKTKIKEIGKADGFSDFFCNVIRSFPETIDEIDKKLDLKDFGDQKYKNSFLTDEKRKEIIEVPYFDQTIRDTVAIALQYDEAYTYRNAYSDKIYDIQKQLIKDMNETNYEEFLTELSQKYPDQVNNFQPYINKINESNSETHSLYNLRDLIYKDSLSKSSLNYKTQKLFCKQGTYFNRCLKLTGLTLLNASSILLENFFTQPSSVGLFIGSIASATLQVHARWKFAHWKKTHEDNCEKFSSIINTCKTAWQEGNENNKYCSDLEKKCKELIPDIDQIKKTIDNQNENTKHLCIPLIKQNKTKFLEHLKTKIPNEEDRLVLEKITKNETPRWKYECEKVINNYFDDITKEVQEQLYSSYQSHLTNDIKKLIKKDHENESIYFRNANQEAERVLKKYYDNHEYNKKNCDHAMRAANIALGLSTMLGFASLANLISEKI